MRRGTNLAVIRFFNGRLVQGDIAIELPQWTIGLLVLAACSVSGVAARGQTTSTSAVKPAAPSPAPAPAPQGGTSAVVMDLSAIESVIGKSVKSPGGEDLGRIIDLLVTTSGQVRGAVIDFGGVLGVGSRKIAVDWKALDFADVKDGSAKLDLTRNQVRVAPEYKSGDPIVILQPTRLEETKAPAATPSTKPASSPAPVLPNSTAVAPLQQLSPAH